MFLKPFKVKSNNQLKGTERKKLCEDVSKTFPSLSDTEIQSLIPKKEAISSMKVVVHGGEICKLYCVARVPMFFELDQPNVKLLPTIYTLWHHPDLLYNFITHSPVVSRLTNGADLMLPGIVLDGPPTLKSYGKLSKNTPVCVATEDNRAAVAVGLTAHSSEEMYMCGGRGKCVNILHVIGDLLCELGKPPVRPQLDPITDVSEPEALGEKIDLSANDDICDGLQVALGDLEKKVDSVDIASNDEDDLGNKCTDLDSLENRKAEDIIPLDPVKEMDKLLEYCFLKACKAVKKGELPLLSSVFFKNHLRPACPSDKNLDVTKSSFKKFSVFLAHMKSKGVIGTSILKGVESIDRIQSQHPLLTDLVVNEEPELAKPDLSNTPVVSECYRVTSDVVPILSKFGYEQGDMMKRTEIRKCFTEYVKKENLQDGKLLKINPQLAGTLRTKESVLSLTMEDAINKFIGRMTHSHEITVRGSTLLHTGKLKPIEITVATRRSCKTVTLVNNLEAFGIKLDEFSKECQGIGAASTVTVVPGKTTPSVLVQGNQVLYVYKLLTENYRIHKNYIKGLEFAPKKRK